MDVAYPVRHVRAAPDYDPLIWSLRSVAAHFPVDRVYLAGGIPSVIDRAKVTHLPTEPGEKWANILANLRAVLASDISEDFLWMNDDFFFLRDMDEFPVYDRGTIRKWLSYANQDDVYFGGMGSQAAILAAWGYDPDSTPNTDMHVPHVLNKTRLKALLDRVADEFPEHPLGHFRMIYGADSESVTLKDPKIKKSDVLPELSWPFASTDDATFTTGLVGHYLRLRYHRPSPFELADGPDLKGGMSMEPYLGELSGPDRELSNQERIYVRNLKSERLRLLGTAKPSRLTAIHAELAKFGIRPVKPAGPTEAAVAGPEEVRGRRGVEVSNTYCVECDREFKNPAGLAAHRRAKHEGDN